MPEKRPLRVLAPPVNLRALSPDEWRAWLRTVVASFKAQEKPHR